MNESIFSFSPSAAMNAHKIERIKDTYYLSADEIAYTIRKYDYDLYQSCLDNGLVLDAMDSFVTDSVDLLMGNVWDSVRYKLEDHMDCLTISSNLNKLINDTQQSCLQKIQNFLIPDSDLNTADLPNLEIERDALEKEIAELEAEIEIAAQVPPTRSEVVGVDEFGNNIYGDVPNEPEFTNARIIMNKNNARIKSVLQPALKETNRLIDKINEFNNIILPAIEKELEEVQEKVNLYVMGLDAFGASNSELFRRFLAVGLEKEDIAYVYNNQDGKPYAIYYYDEHLYIDYSNPNDIQYKRFNPETGELSNISIFDYENEMSIQYGANQMAFSENFEELINKPIIWEEMQKYYPVESFDSYDDAMEFYERYFSNITNTGCGYAAATNIIFERYEGREKEFEEIFGFPMYNISDEGKIDFNYEIMELKYFNYDWADKGYTIDQMEKGQNVSTYLEDFFKPEAVSTAARLGNVDDFLETYGVSSNAKTDTANRFPIFRNDVGINKLINNKYEENDFLVYGGSGWDLYDNNGNLYSEDGGGHYMIINEFTEDGNPIVSSWGEKYVLDIRGNKVTDDVYRLSYINFD